MSALRIGLYSVDPVGLTSYHAFDPESYFLVTTLADQLIQIDLNGDVQPSLATSWSRASPTSVEFQLREGVEFHNGEEVDADSVVATFRAHREPTPSKSAGVLSTLAAVTKLGKYRFLLETKMPDAMLMRRLFWSEIYPASVLTQHGRDHLAHTPIGAGAYKLVHWKRGHEIVLQRHERHWAKRATVDEIRLPILRRKEWVDRLAKGELDAAWDIDSNDRIRAARFPGVRVVSRESAVAQWFLLRNRGPLKDLAVRQALNHAINRPLLVDLTEHGYGEPQRGIATRQQQGYTELEAFRYSPELSRRLLQQAGYKEGFVLRGIVSETSTALYFMVREFLARVGVRLEAEIVPRAEWIGKVVMGNFAGKPYDCDFAVASLDNPLLDSLFHQFIFLFSHGPFSLTQDEAYDQQFLRAASTIDPPDCPQPETGRAKLERYARDQAMLLFTVQQQVHAAWREGVDVPLPKSGHFGAPAFWNVRVVSERAADAPDPSRPAPASEDLKSLLEGTSHTGTFYLQPGTTFNETSVRQIWKNIVTSEERWHVQNEPMFRELVSQLEAKTSLANVLDSTDRVAIAGYTSEQRLLFVNRGYELMFGRQGPSAFEILDAAASTPWPRIRDEVEAKGAWLGPVAVTGIKGTKLELYLSVTRAIDDEGAVIGHTFVFSDFSGEQERIKTEAIRSILDNVPYGLFRCDARARMLPGYSSAARQFFHARSSEVVGVELTELLQLPAREARHFAVCYEQIFEDLLPEEVNLAQLPSQLQLGERICRLSASVVRDAAGGVSSVLFTLLDITAQVEAEREVERLRSVVQVMRFKSSFEAFVRGFLSGIRVLAATSLDGEHQLEARRALHTAKGVFAQFGLMELARQIHRIEDRSRISQADLSEVRSGIVNLVRENHVLWGIELDRTEERFVISNDVLTHVETCAARATSLEELRAMLSESLSTIRERSVAELAGPLERNHDLLCRRLGKSSKFTLYGAELRCPARLAGVFSSLTHLVRNALDHGVEAPGERGDKPEQASLELFANRTASEVVLRIIDDGRGIDVADVAERAVRLGVITTVELERLSPAERLQLVFADGISTAKEVTDTSGRGVGMSAVRHAVHAVGGSIAIESELGRRTVVELRLPLASPP